MNTTEKGDKFESRSLDIIHKLIEEERLGETAKYLQIFPQKEYYPICGRNRLSLI